MAKRAGLPRGCTNSYVLARARLEERLRVVPDHPDDLSTGLTLNRAAPIFATEVSREVGRFIQRESFPYQSPPLGQMLGRPRHLKVVNIDGQEEFELGVPETAAPFPVPQVLVAYAAEVFLAVALPVSTGIWVAIEGPEEPAHRTLDIFHSGGTRVSGSSTHVSVPFRYA